MKPWRKLAADNLRCGAGGDNLQAALALAGHSTPNTGTYMEMAWASAAILRTEGGAPFGWCATHHDTMAFNLLSMLSAGANKEARAYKKISKHFPDTWSMLSS